MKFLYFKVIIINYRRGLRISLSVKCFIYFPEKFKGSDPLKAHVTDMFRKPWFYNLFTIKLLLLDFTMKCR